MKKVLRSLTVLIVAGILLMGCSKNTPTSVATTWLNSVYHAEYDAAIPLSTDLTKKQIAQLSQLSSYLSDSTKKELKKLTITVKDVKEKGDTATAVYTLSDNKREQSLMMIKQNGKWLVAFTKNDSYINSDLNNAPDLPSADTTAQAATPVDTAATDTAKNKD
jgi:hypothetical protein